MKMEGYQERSDKQNETGIESKNTGNTDEYK